MKARIPDVSSAARALYEDCDVVREMQQRTRLLEMAQKNTALRLDMRHRTWSDVLKGDDVIPLLRVCRADASHPWAYARTGRFFGDAVLTSARYLKASMRAGHRVDDAAARLGAIWFDRGAPPLIATIILRAALARIRDE